MNKGPFPLDEITIRELQGQMTDGELTAERIFELYLDRIKDYDSGDPAVNSVFETNPDALEIARELDVERRSKGPRGPLHGIPVLLKANIDTADKMLTTAGSLALAGHRATRDAHVAAKLREAGAILLGKTNLGEWANFRSSHSIGSWSSLGGQVRNPYALDRSPCGSSSGSGAAIAANFAAVALGTETDGSIVCPSAFHSLVGLKPTVGLTSRAGVIPISHSQDTVGPMSRTVEDAAIVLTAIAGADPRDSATAASNGHATDYTRFLDSSGLERARVGVLREDYFVREERTVTLVEAAIEDMRKLGATVVDPVKLPSQSGLKGSDWEYQVLLYEFKADLDAYLANLPPEFPIHSLEDVIRFNREHSAETMAFFGQDILEEAQAKGPLSEPEYLKALENSRRLTRQEGIDAALSEHNLDALVAPTGGPPFKLDPILGDYRYGGSCGPSAMAGYPLITVPAGFVRGLPIGITFMGTAYSEPTLIKLAHAYEQATQHRRPPTFARSLDPEGF